MYLKVTLVPILALFTFLRISESPKSPTRLDSGISQCHTTTQSFAQLGSDPEFMAAHEDPFTLEGYEPKGKMIQYEVAGGEKANAYFLKTKKASKDYLIVIHEWYGLNDYVKKESDTFFGKYANMNVLALDLYDGKVATNSEDAGKYMQAVKTERALAIINAVKKFAGADANIYTVGWCFGGGWSLQAAIEFQSQAKGAVMFYGMPEKELSRLKTLKCDVLGIFAESDKWIGPAVAEAFKENMEKADLKLDLYSYKADHGFANPSNPNYNAEAASDAYTKMFDFIGARR